MSRKNGRTAALRYRYLSSGVNVVYYGLKSCILTEIAAVLLTIEERTNIKNDFKGIRRINIKRQIITGYLSASV